MTTRLDLPTIFTTPDTPDLGCFVRQSHAFEIDAHFHMWAEPPPFEIVDDAIHYRAHQTYFRIKCGEAAYYQRVHAWMRDTWDALVVLASTPDWTLGGDHRPTPTDWVKFPPQSGRMTYWFAGEHRDPSSTSWQWDAMVGHSYDIYERGTLSTVGWDDTGGDRDMNDLVIEVAVVYRRAYFDKLAPAVRREADLNSFVTDVLPEYRRRDPARRKEAGGEG